VALTLAGILAACSAAAQPAAPAPPAATPLRPQPTPVPTVARPAAPPAIKIGVLEPLTGPLASRGVDYVDGLRLFLASVNGSIADREVELAVRDAHDDPVAVVAQAADDGVSLLTGLETSSACSAAAQEAARRQLPLAITGDCGLPAIPRSPYVTRWTYTPSGEVDAAADWAAKNGYHKAILITTGDARGVQTSDAFASAFVARGGAVVQELHPAPGANLDPGQLTAAADIVVEHLRQPDAIRFGQAYLATRKLPVIDLFGHLSTGEGLSAVRELALGVYTVGSYLDNFDSPVNREFGRAWRARYADRPISASAAAGYSAGQIVAATVKGAAGKAEDKPVVLQSLHHADVETVRGRLRLDKQGDVVQTVYVSHVTSVNGHLANGLLQTYVDVGRTWDRTPDQLEAFSFGAHAGQWVGMTRDRLGPVVTQRSLYQFFGPSEIR
jgi:branched-chain amino acid transport system substrate-binding protein